MTTIACIDLQLPIKDGGKSDYTKALDLNSVNVRREKVLPVCTRHLCSVWCRCSSGRITEQSEELVVPKALAINNESDSGRWEREVRTKTKTNRRWCWVGDTSDDCDELRDLQEPGSRQQLQYIDAGGRKSSRCREWWLWGTCVSGTGACYRVQCTSNDVRNSLNTQTRTAALAYWSRAA